MTPSPFERPPAFITPWLTTSPLPTPAIQMRDASIEIFEEIASSDELAQPRWVALRVRLARLTGLPARARAEGPLAERSAADEADLSAQVAALRGSAKEALLSTKTRAQGRREWEQLLNQLVRASLPRRLRREGQHVVPIFWGGWL